MNSSILCTLFLLLSLALTTSGAETQKTNAPPLKGPFVACSDIPKGGYEFEVPGVGKCLLMSAVSSKTKGKGTCRVDLDSLKTAVKTEVKKHGQVQKKIIKILLNVYFDDDGRAICWGKGTACVLTVVARK